MDIEFNVNQQLIRQNTEAQPANKSQEYLHLKFNFKSDDWDELTKFVLFSKDGIKYRIPITNSKALVPNACLTGDRFSFSIYGLDNEDMRITTNRVVVHLNESGYTTDVENDIPDDDPTIVEQIYLDIAAAETEAKNYTDTGLSGKSDVGHTHKEADITDLKSYALSTHNHDDRYYTESEVDSIISDLKDSILNRCNFTSDKQIIQTDEVADITALIIEDGIPKNNDTIYFYELVEEDE